MNGSDVVPQWIDTPTLEGHSSHAPRGLGLARVLLLCALVGHLVAQFARPCARAAEWGIGFVKQWLHIARWSIKGHLYYVGLLRRPTSTRARNRWLYGRNKFTPFSFAKELQRTATAQC